MWRTYVCLLGILRPFAVGITQKLIHTKINIEIDNSEIEQVFSTKFLGVIINENLTI